MSESKTILISGGAGYVGSALVSRILRDTDWKVKVFDDLMYGGNSLFQFFNFDRFSFIKGDLRKFQMEKKILLFQQPQQVITVDQLRGDHKDWV